MTPSPQEPTARAERAGDCDWCGAPLTLTDYENGSGDYCPEGQAVGPKGTSPHRLVPAAATERLERAERERDYLKGAFLDDPLTFATDPDGDCWFCGGPTEPIEDHDEDGNDCRVTWARLRLVRSEGSDAEPDGSMSLLDRDTYNRLAGSAEPDGGGGAP